jgi:hypothetical protein
MDYINKLYIKSRISLLHFVFLDVHVNKCRLTVNYSFDNDAFSNLHGSN